MVVPCRMGNGGVVLLGHLTAFLGAIGRLPTFQGQQASFGVPLFCSWRDDARAPPLSNWPRCGCCSASTQVRRQCERCRNTAVVHASCSLPHSRQNGNFLGGRLLLPEILKSFHPLKMPFLRIEGATLSLGGEAAHSSETCTPVPDRLRWRTSWLRLGAGRSCWRRGSPEWDETEHAAGGHELHRGHCR